MTLTSSVIKNFKETIQKLKIAEKPFNDNVNKMGLDLHQLKDKLTLSKAKLSFFEKCGKLMD